MSTYELIGRQAERIAHLEENLANALSVLRQVTTGEITPDRLLLLPDGGVRVQPALQSGPTPIRAVE